MDTVSLYRQPRSTTGSGTLGLGYKGPAVLVAGEAEMAVEAHLVRDDDPDRLGGWGGFVTATPTVLGDLLGLHVVLRLPDGTVLIMGGGRVEGSGNPPFDT